MVKLHWQFSLDFSKLYVHLRKETTASREIHVTSQRHLCFLYQDNHSQVVVGATCKRNKTSIHWTSENIDQSVEIAKVIDLNEVPYRIINIPYSGYISRV